MLDPYAPPQAELAKKPAELPMPSHVRALILSGVAAAAITAFFTAVGTARIFGQPGASLYVLFDSCVMLVMLALGYGTYRGSRTCAMLALLTYIVLHVVSAIRHGTEPGWVTLAMAFLFLLGATGAFAWHAWRAAQRTVGAN